MLAKPEPSRSAAGERVETTPFASPHFSEGCTKRSQVKAVARCPSDEEWHSSDSTEAAAGHYKRTSPAPGSPRHNGPGFNIYAYLESAAHYAPRTDVPEPLEPTPHHSRFTSHLQNGQEGQGDRRPGHSRGRGWRARRPRAVHIGVSAMCMSEMHNRAIAIQKGK